MVYTTWHDKSSTRKHATYSSPCSKKKASATVRFIPYGFRRRVHITRSSSSRQIVRFVSDLTREHKPSTVSIILSLDIPRITTWNLLLHMLAVFERHVMPAAKKFLSTRPHRQFTMSYEHPKEWFSSEL